jgi:alanine racemase
MLKVLLLCGGKGNEKNISLNSARSVYDHLKGLGSVLLSVVFFDADDKCYAISEDYLYSNTAADFRFFLKSAVTPLTEAELYGLYKDCDLVFPLIHGIGCEDGRIQKYLESINVKYVGSSSTACSMMYNKHTANEEILKKLHMTNVNKIFISSSTPNLESVIGTFMNEHGDVCIKPSEGGSSFGVGFASSPEEAICGYKSKNYNDSTKTIGIKNLLNEYDEMVVEEKIIGHEFTIIVLENNGVPVSLMPTEIEVVDSSNTLFDGRRKYMSTTEVRYHCPARFCDDIIQQIRTDAELLFSKIGANDFLRIDGWLLNDNKIYFSDFNPISGMEQNSFIFQQATKVGFTHSSLLEYILHNACVRNKIEYTSVDSQQQNKRLVNILLGGITSERQVSLLSGTNVWLKLLYSEKYTPVPYVLTTSEFKNNNEYLATDDSTVDWIVHQIPYSLALLHTTEEIINQIDNNRDYELLVTEIRTRLSLNGQFQENRNSWVSLEDFIKTSKSEDAYIFLGLHGGFGENGGIQSLFDKYGIAYNGSDAAASKLCMNKYDTGLMISELNLPLLRTCKKLLGNYATTWDNLVREIGTPIIAKPNADGCSTGVVKLLNSDDLNKYYTYCKQGIPIPKYTFSNQTDIIAVPHDVQSILFEEFIPSDTISASNNDGSIVYTSDTGWVELTIGVLEKAGRYHAFNPSVTVAESGILSVEEKFQGGIGVNLTPPPENIMPLVLSKRVQYFAERVAEKCGVEDYCRIDMFANNKTGAVIVIEINTLPGLSPSTVLFQQSARECPSLAPLALLEYIMSDDGGNDMDKLSFSEIVACTGGCSSFTGNDFYVSDVKFDSRENMKGSAFIAFCTEKDNGHKYVDIAAQKGALLAIVSEDVTTNIPTIKVQDTRKVFLKIAAFYRSKFNIPVVAITGSNGKTTVKDMLSAALSPKYKVLATEKNSNNDIGLPQTLLKLNSNYTAVVVEMGTNHKGEIHVLSETAQPSIAAITKIGMAHIGNFEGSKDELFKAKMEIVDGLQPNGILVLPSNDPILSMSQSKYYSVVFCGTSEDSRNLLYASDINQTCNETSIGIDFLVNYEGSAYPCHLPVLGRHNVSNALIALTISVKLGVSLVSAIDALRLYPRSSMRLDIASIRGIRFIKDYYNASPDSMESALDTLASMDCKGKKVAILGDMLELGEKSALLHKNVSSYSVGKADIVYYVGSYGSDVSNGRGDCRCYTNKEELNIALSSAYLKHEFDDAIILIKGSNGSKMGEQYDFLYKLIDMGRIAPPAQTRLLVDTDALRHNYTAIKRYVGQNAQVLPVIKADAYGSGADTLSNVYYDCNFFAVSDLREAYELHDVMPNATFLILYQPFIKEINSIIKHDYIVTSVSDINFVRELNSSANNAKKTVHVHIEVDTGMSRLGVQLDDCEDLALEMKRCNNIVVDGIYTHYSSADMYGAEDLEFTRLQTERFESAITIFERILGTIHFKHACASAAIFNPAAKLFNMVRPGYMLMGYYPCNEIESKIELRPALQYVTKVTQIKEFEAGECVSYGRKFVTDRKTRIAEIPVGYSDGLMRRLSSKGAFVINGQLAPIIGNVTMDYTMVDVTNIKPMVWVGDNVSIFDNENMTIERMAELCDTIGYEIITNIKNKADRIETF